MLSDHVDEREREATADDRLVGASGSAFPSSCMKTIRMQHNRTKTQRITVATLHHDPPRVVHHSISILGTPTGHDNCTISCPTSPTAFSKYEADVLGKPHDLFDKTILVINGREGEARHQQDGISNMITADTNISIPSERWNPLPKTTVVSSGQLLDESFRFRDQHRRSKLSPRYMRSPFRAQYPDHRRTQSLGSNTRPDKPDYACVASRMRITSAHPQSNEGSGRRVAAQDWENRQSASRNKSEERLARDIQVPNLVIQETWDANEHALECADSCHQIKSEVDDISTMSEAALSCVSKPLICRDLSCEKDSATADITPPDYQNLIKKLDIDVDLVTLTCIGTTKKGVKCKCHLSKSTRIEVQRAVRSLMAIDLSKDYKKLSEKLELLAYMVLCKRYHQHSQAAEVVNIWREKLSHPISGNMSPYLVETILLPKKSALQSPEIDHKEGSQTSVPRDVLLPYGAVYNEHYAIRILVPFDPKAKSSPNTGDFLRSSIMRDLTRREIINSGLIYIYWFPGNFGHIKIGVTTRDVKERLKEWEKQCGHRPLLLYPILPADKKPIAHVFRVEALVHAELRNCRKTEVKCKACRRNHKEWFEKSVPDAIAAVGKWSAWMRTEPYVEEMIPEWDDKSESMVNRSNWKLKSEHLEHIHSLCKPLPDISTPLPSSQHQRPRIGRPSTDPGARSNRPRSKSPRYTRSNALKSRSKTGLPDNSTSNPHFSEFFSKTESTKDKSSDALAV